MIKKVRSSISPIVGLKNVYHKVSVNEFLLCSGTEIAFLFFYLIFDIKNTNVLVKHINRSDLNCKVMVYNILGHGFSFCFL